METTTVSNIPVFENTGLTELNKAWKQYSGSDVNTLIGIAEDHFAQGSFAVSLFLADRILKEKNPDEEARIRLRFIRAESLYEYKFYRQAYPDYVYYIKQRGETEELRKKLRMCKRMIHTGNTGTVLFIAVFALSIDIMFLALYQLREMFEMGLNLEWIYYTMGISGAMLLGGLFYRYVIISRMK